MKKLILLLVIVIVIINLPPAKWIAGEEDIYYSNEKGTFTFDESNYAGRNFELCMDNFEAYKSIVKKDTLLYRISPINILKFWRLGDYIFKKKYRLPYKDWKEIENIRGAIVNKTAWQAF